MSIRTAYNQHSTRRIMEKNELDRQPEESGGTPEFLSSAIDKKRHLFPHCLIWTPIPCITWIFPFIGHMGIATSSGVIRDFAGSYYVSENEMAFGWPTRYIQLDLNRVTLPGDEVDSSSDPSARRYAAAAVWDRAVFEASEVYKRRVHNLCCDNCHSHCALALEKMCYRGRSSWNMVQLAGWMLVAGRYVNGAGFLKTWLPFLVLVTVIVLVCVLASTL